MYTNGPSVYINKASLLATSAGGRNFFRHLIAHRFHLCNYNKGSVHYQCDSLLTSSMACCTSPMHISTNIRAVSRNVPDKGNRGNIATYHMPISYLWHRSPLVREYAPNLCDLEIGGRPCHHLVDLHRVLIVA